MDKLLKSGAGSKWATFWGSHQRFFRALCINCKMPALLEQIKFELKEGKCCVVGLQSTGEARITDAVEVGEELDEFLRSVLQRLLARLQLIKIFNSDKIPTCTNELQHGFQLTSRVHMVARAYVCKTR